MKVLHRILVATDLSPASTPAFDEAIEMAKQSGAELMIAHAYQLPSLFQADGYIAPSVYEEWDESLRTEVEKRLQSLVEGAKKSGVAARPLVLAGAPYEAIAQAAEEYGVDLVIMGTHGRKGVSRFFLGSVASRVIATAPCPVLTVRAA